MTKRLIATMAAASIALASFSATPAAADSDRTIKMLIGVGTLLALGHALSNQDRNKRKAGPVYRYNKPHKPHKPHYNNRNVIVVPSHCVHGHGPNRWVDWNCARRY